MLRLIRKELIFNRNNLILLLTLITGFLMLFLARAENFKSTGFMIFCAFYVGASLCVTLMAQEDKYKTASLTCSLPCRRRDVVRARFILTWALMLVTLVYTTFLAAVLPFSRADVGQALNLKVFLVMLFVLTVVIAAMLPFSIRFGVMGIILILVAVQVLGLITVSLAQFLGGKPIHFFATVEAAVRWLKFLAGPGSTAVQMLLLGAAVLVINAASLFASQALYARKEM